MHRRFRLSSVVAVLAVALSSAVAAPGAELLVADQAGNRVIALDETTGEFLRVVTSTGLDLPSSLAFGPGGFLYATNFGAYAGPGSKASVVKIDVATGATTDFITDVAGPGAVAYNAVHHPGSLFVSKLASFTQSGADFSGNEVFQYSAPGGGAPTLTRTIGSGSAATGRSGMTFDDEGNLYVTAFSFFNVGSVLKYDGHGDFSPLGTYASGAGVTIQGPSGALIPSLAGGLNGLAFVGDTLYAAALTGTAVVKFVDQEMGVVGQQVSGPIAYPSGLLAAGDGTVLITSLGNNNPADPFYPSQTFPGTILRYHPATGAVTPLLAGDANRDNQVDAADLAVLTASFGVDAAGDLDGDLDTDGADFLVWQRGFGKQSAGSASFLPTGIVRYEPPVVAAATVPEPATIGLTAIGALVAAVVRRRQA